MEVSVRGDTILFGDGLGVQLQRTLRTPDDGRSYPLPPGFGPFPVRPVDDYASRVPPQWRDKGGVMVPMYQREAMWILFSGQAWKPRAVKVAVGKVCAITGRRWSESLGADPIDYLVTPPQPWLDGICAGPGTIRQFVAMPLGLGYTVEGQRTGEERFGGIQLKVFEPKPGRFPDAPPFGMAGAFDECAAMGAAPSCAPPLRRRSGAMGLGAGGRMKQKIYPDPHGIETWDASRSARCFVHIVNSELWREITGEQAPPTPITAKEYAAHGFPWFDLYDETMPSVGTSKELSQVKSVKEIDQTKSTLPLQDDDPVEPGPVKKLWTAIAGKKVRDGSW